MSQPPAKSHMLPVQRTWPRTGHLLFCGQCIQGSCANLLLGNQGTLLVMLGCGRYEAVYAGVAAAAAGMRMRSPQSPLLGLMWVDPGRADPLNLIRHEAQQRDGG